MKLKPLLLLTLSPLFMQALADDGRVAARVNGQAISEFRLERYFTEYLEEQGRAVASIRSPQAYRQLRQAALGELIDKELLWQEAGRRGVIISDSAVQAQVEQTRQAFGSPQRFNQRLQDAGFDEHSYADYTRRELAARQVYAQWGQVPAPTDEQVRAFMDENRLLITSQNHLQGADVEPLQGLEAARALLGSRQQAQARQQALARLRTQGSVERIDAH
ncbi:MAG: SurA N-terminal domain-containing protein [Pseudomonas sp.]|uniref:SurA N-terminal domain-containing protein n=1 Tax=Pseudomonas abieticivorans TaxID=2931382 RepID=UPI0020BE30EE|nr:SurA N-terminal domain-containing protein [Pseudomonas sp. PIA16]MDE1164584.1 SurA N-terminal domain-containing protein [Pseudomonas sp.]